MASTIPPPTNLVGKGKGAGPNRAVATRSPEEMRPSKLRFPDGVAFRIEIPSVEGPSCVRAVLTEADRLSVPVRRLSQGSGVTLTSDDELDEMVSLCAAAGVELSLFARPCAQWGTSSAARAPSGQVFGPSVYGDGQLRAALAEIGRAAEHGVRSVLIADIGLLAAFGRLRLGGHLPSDMQAKVSAMLPISNSATAEVLVSLGADTLNVQPDLPLQDIVAIRSVVDVPIDMYIEAPDNLGGFLRYHELAALVQYAAPIYLKFGLRNGPDVYPAGTHLEQVTTSLSIERVRRAKLGIEALERDGIRLETSARGAKGLAIPVLAETPPT